MKFQGRLKLYIPQARKALTELSLQYKRLAITGPPGAGKTTCTRHMPTVWQTDTLFHKGIPWDDQPAALLEQVKGKEWWLIEGVTVARTLRHGLNAQAVVHMTSDYQEEEPPPGRVRLAKSVERWMDEARDKHPAHLYEIHLLAPMEITYAQKA
jgi:energy-coupling factor transporter ATP-binding protein EcfA2